MNIMDLAIESETELIIQLITRLLHVSHNSMLTAFTTAIVGVIDTSLDNINSDSDNNSSDSDNNSSDSDSTSQIRTSEEIDYSSSEYKGPPKSLLKWYNYLSYEYKDRFWGSK
ncbi:hypothetical protein Tco_1292175 [Tanacetum coccineum]